MSKRDLTDREIERVQNGPAAKAATEIVKRRFGEDCRADIEYDYNGDTFLYVMKRGVKESVGGTNTVGDRSLGWVFEDGHTSERRMVTVARRLAENATIYEEYRDLFRKRK